jgi:hypothetical protein
VEIMRSVLLVARFAVLAVYLYASFGFIVVEGRWVGGNKIESWDF